MNEGAIISDFISPTRTSRRLTAEDLGLDLKQEPGSKPGSGKRHEGAIISNFIAPPRTSRRLTAQDLWPDLMKEPGSKPGSGKRHEGAIISDFIPCTRVSTVITADYLWPDLKGGKWYSKPVIDLDDDFEIEFQEFKDEESDMDDFDDDIDDVLADIKPLACSATAKPPPGVSREMEAHFERARELKRKREEKLKEIHKGKRPASAYDTSPRPSMTRARLGGFMSDARKTTRQRVTAPVTQAALFSTAEGIMTREAAHDREQASTSVSAPQQEKPKKGARAIMEDFMKILGLGFLKPLRTLRRGSRRLLLLP